MNFQQLRIIRETLRRNFNLTEVASHLFTSQSGVSKHIKDLEDELGVELFVRKGKRLTGLTHPGRDIVKYVDRMLNDASNIKNLAEHYSSQDTGELVVATTHTQARYTLPLIVAKFKKAYPKVHLKLLQGSPEEITKLLHSGDADIGIATESIMESDEFALFPFYAWQHAVIVPRNHPLNECQSLSLRDIAQYPIITYHEGFTGRAKLDQAFQAAELQPDIVMSALDADVIKTYVELEMGIGIIASVAFNPEKDTDLIKLPSEHLFAANITRIAVRKNHFLRRFGYHFIELCAPDLKEGEIKGKLLMADE